MTIKFRNGDKVIGELTSTGNRVVENARKTMRASVNRIVKRAKLYTPEDTTSLMESIRAEAKYVGARGRLAFDIVVGGMLYGRNVDEYATVVHEAYETQIAVHGPGPRTQAKMDANPGVFIGSKFLERAAEEEEARLGPKMIGAIAKAVKGETVAETDDGDEEDYDE